MTVGDVAEHVVVTGETPLLDASTASTGQVIDQRRIVELPLNGGNAFNLTRFTAGVNSYAIPNHATLATAPDVVSRFSINGSGNNNSEFMIDGTPSMYGQNNAYIPPVDMVQEFRVQTATYDARLGHSPGGNINLMLRSGSNAFHGTLYEFHNNRSLEGLSFFERQRFYDAATGPPTREKNDSIHPKHIINRWGGTVGGPLLLPRIYNGRNRTFWIYGYEGLIRPSAAEGNAFYTVPTSRQRQGDFSQLLSLGPAFQIYDPATIRPAANGRYSRLPLAGNIVPASRIDPLARNLFAYWPEPNSAGAADGRNNYFVRPPTRNWFHNHLSRFDHNFSDKYRVFARYAQTNATNRAGQVFPSPTIGEDQVRGHKGLGLDGVYIFSPSFLLNVRYGLSRYTYWRVPRAAGFDFQSAGFSRDLVSRLEPQAITFPYLAVDGLTPLGTNSPSGNFTNYHVWSADLTNIRGNHSLRYGGEYRLFRESNYTFSNQVPRINFDATWTNGPFDNSPGAPMGPGMASFLLGIPSSGQITVNPSSADQSTYTAFYMQDDWKVTSRLTVNLGLRYEYESPIVERYNRSVRGFDFTSANPIEAEAQRNYAGSPLPEIAAGQFRAPGGLLFAGVNGQPRGLWASDRNNLAPRVGFAWQLSPKTVFRGGYAIFFVPVGNDRADVNQGGFSQRTTLVPSTDNGQTFVASLANPFPNGFAQPRGAAGGLSTDVGQAVSHFREKVLNGYMQRWSLGVQRQLPRRIVVEASYVANRAVKLPVNTELDYIPQQYLSQSPVRDDAAINRLSAQVPNPFFPLLAGTGLAGRTVQRSQLLRPYPHFTGLRRSEPAGYSWFHSLQTSVERRFANGFQVQGTYTWAKFMEAINYLTDGDTRPEEVISDLDRPHRFTLTGMWELPIGRGRAFFPGARGIVGHLMSGWQLQAAYEAQSGGPVAFGNLIFQGDIKGVTIPNSERTLNRWFNTTGFERDARRQLQFNVRRFSSRFTGIETHGINMWNASGTKNFRLREGMRLQFRSEWANAMNHSHFSGPVVVPTNLLFGSVTATTGRPRQIHFALKLVF